MHADALSYMQTEILEENCNITKMIKMLGFNVLVSNDEN